MSNLVLGADLLWKVPKVISGGWKATYFIKDS